MVLGPPALAQGSLAQGGRDVNLWPALSFEIVSPLGPQAARQALAAHTGPPRRFAPIGLPSRANDMHFHGTVDAAGFQIMRITGYANVFAPHTSGAIEANGAGSRIAVRMDGQRAFLVMLGVWSAFIVIAFINVLLPAALLFIPPAYVLALAMFNFEARLQRRALRTIFRAL